MLVDEALVGAIVGIGEEWEPAGREAACFHCEAVVLRRDEAALRVLVQAGLVVPAVPVTGWWDTCQAAPAARTPAVTLDPHSLHLVGTGTKGQGKQLVSQADPKNGLGLGRIQHLA